MSTFASTKSSNRGGNKYRTSYSKSQPFPQVDVSASSMTFEDMKELFKQDEVDSRQHSTKWVKLNKTLKKQKIQKFVEKYAVDNSLPPPEILTLRVFLCGMVDEGKLNRAKDVVMDKSTHDIVSIPTLVRHPITQQFHLKTIHPKRPANVFVNTSSHAKR